MPPTTEESKKIQIPKSSKSTSLIENYSYKLADKDRTYDKILSAYLNDAEVLDSWIVLQSSQYGYIHALKLRDIQRWKES